jgi:O-methyltransferase involved in polyketide biosynthesis
MYRKTLITFYRSWNGPNQDLLWNHIDKSSSKQSRSCWTYMVPTWSARVMKENPNPNKVDLLSAMTPSCSHHSLEDVNKWLNDRIMIQVCDYGLEAHK